MAYRIDSDSNTAPEQQATSSIPLKSQIESQHSTSNGKRKLTVGLMLLMSNPLDCESVGEQFSGRSDTKMLDASHNLQFAIQRIVQLRPHVLLFDPKNSLRNIQPVLSLVESGFICNLIILDDRVREGVLLQALDTPRTSYITRKCGFSAIHSAVLAMGRDDKRVFDPLVEKRLIREPGGIRLLSPTDQASLASLTPREVDVLKMVALGFTVRDCARLLKVSTSTIDNHKAKLMKKLKIHKVPKLTRLAIREGLISA